MSGKQTIVAVDVGNSAAKIAIGQEPPTPEVDCVTAFPGGPGQRLQTISLDQSDWTTDVCRWVRQHVAGDDIAWWVSTVNRAASQPLQRCVAEQFASFQWHAIDHRAVPMEIEVDFADRVGIDRLIGAYAASLRFPRPLVLVDAGSAVTIDWVSAGPSDASTFHGGAILPGIRLQLAALANGTEGIEPAFGSSIEGGSPVPADRPANIDVQPNIDVLGPGKNTQQAIRRGVMAGICGGIERLAVDYARTSVKTDASGRVPQIVLTGGDAAAISGFLRVEHVLVPGLVCRGLFDLAWRKCQTGCGGLE